LGTDTDELEAVLAEPDLTSETSNEQRIDLLAIYEAVARISKDAEQTNRDTRKVLKALAGSPEGMQKAAHGGVTKALVKFDKEARALEAKERSSEQRSDELKHQGYLWLMLGVVSGVLVFGALALASYLFYAPKIAEYQAYRNSHQAVQRASLYGARLGKKDGVEFMLFDEGTKIEVCEAPKHCITINR